jgi:hypothetical protein
VPRSQSVGLHNPHFEQGPTELAGLGKNEQGLASLAQFRVSGSQGRVPTRGGALWLTGRRSLPTPAFDSVRPPGAGVATLPILSLPSYPTAHLAEVDVTSVTRCRRASVLTAACPSIGCAGTSAGDGLIALPRPPRRLLGGASRAGRLLRERGPAVRLRTGPLSLWLPPRAVT